LRDNVVSCRIEQTSQLERLYKIGRIAELNYKIMSRLVNLGVPWVEKQNEFLG